MKIKYVLTILLLTLPIGIKPIYGDVQIYNIPDYSFGIVLPDQKNKQITKRLCVYNSAGSNYYITATGMHDLGNNFYLSSGVSNLKYQFRWRGRTGGYVNLKPGMPASFTGAVQQIQCQGTRNRDLARLRIKIAGSDLKPQLTSGFYSDTVTILLEPG